MIPEKMKDVLKHEGVVAIVTNGEDGAHVVNTWNSYIQITEDGRLLAPASRMNKTEANTKKDNRVLVTMGSREVEGRFSMGTGFLISGTASFSSEGDEFSSMKQKFQWARAIIVIKPDTITQTL